MYFFVFFFFLWEGDLSNETDEIRGRTRRLAKYMGYVFLLVSYLYSTVKVPIDVGDVFFLGRCCCVTILLSRHVANTHLFVRSAFVAN